MAVAYAGCASLVSAADSWLPANPSTQTVSATPLSTLSGAIRPLVCQYDGAGLVAAIPFSDGGAKAGDTQWSCELRTAPAADATDVTATFKVVSGGATNAGVAVAFDFAEWSPSNYVLAPGMVYDGNRFRILPVGYPSFINDPKLRPIGMPLSTANILHLNKDGSHAKIEMNTGNVATPMLAFYDPKGKRGFVMLTEQGPLGNSGLMIEEDAGPQTAQKRISFVVSAPGVRSQRYVMCGRAPSGDSGAAFAQGDSVTLRFRLYNFAAADLLAYFRKVFEVRKALTGPNGHATVTPYSATVGFITAHHDAHKWSETKDFGFYCNRPGNSSIYAYSTGFATLYSYFAFADPTLEHLRRGGRTLDYLKASQAKTGLFPCFFRNGEASGWPIGSPLATPRNSAHILDWGIQELELLRAHGLAGTIQPEWEAMFRRCADAFVAFYDDNGEFGQFLDTNTAKMEVSGSTHGADCVVALARASRYFNEPRYLACAEKAGEQFFARDITKGYAGGAPGDAMQAPDMEAPAGLVDGYTLLYDLTGKEIWLSHARDAAHLFGTWMVSYDYQFPAGSAMRKAGTLASGSVFANSQNNHSSPGYWVKAGEFMLKLYRATGDRLYADMYRDTSRNVIQYVGAPHNPLRKESGYVTERVQLSDWEGRHTIGTVNYSDSNMGWEALALVTALKNPGIYLNTTTRDLLVLDHIEARVSGNSSNTLTLEIKNPTPCDARVAILAESAEQAKKPMTDTAAIGWPRVEVKAGQTRSVEIAPEGTLK
jgi:hypothetical protein